MNLSPVQVDSRPHVMVDSPGEKLPAKKTFNENGYVRFWRKPFRGKYEHRLVMAEQCRLSCPLPLGKDGLPEGMVVHHIDRNKTNNSPENLMLLAPAIHDAITAANQRMDYARAGFMQLNYTGTDRVAVQPDRYAPLREAEILVKMSKIPPMRDAPSRSSALALA